jgi:hypothetical protein
MLEVSLYMAELRELNLMDLSRQSRPALSNRTSMKQPLSLAFFR